MTRHEDMSRCDVCHVSGGDSCDSVTDAGMLRLHSRHQAGEETSERDKISQNISVFSVYMKVVAWDEIFVSAG